MKTSTSICFYLVRHGETVWNTEKRLQGVLDSCLTNRGIAQIKALFPVLESQSIDYIYSSPLGRAQSSAQLFSHHLNLPVEIIDDLKERHFGVWQAQLFESLSSDVLFDSILLQVTSNKPEGGESGLSCAKRMRTCLTHLAEDLAGANLLIMTHGDILRCFLSEISKNIGGDAYSQYGNGRVFKVLYFPNKKLFTLA